MAYHRVCIAAAISVMPMAAQAQTDPGKVVDDLVACRAIVEPGARLACFDRTAAAIGAAREKKQIVILDREGVREAKKSVFGFSLPRIKLFGGGDDEPEVTEINDRIENVRDAGNGKMLFRLKGGTFWQTTEVLLGFEAKAGQAIRIESGVLGSYKAFVPRNRPIRVKRVQ